MFIEAVLKDKQRPTVRTVPKHEKLIRPECSVRHYPGEVALPTLWPQPDQSRQTALLIGSEVSPRLPVAIESSLAADQPIGMPHHDPCSYQISRMLPDGPRSHCTTRSGEMTAMLVSRRDAAECLLPIHVNMQPFGSGPFSSTKGNSPKTGLAG
jgi:hypothetical protein